MGCFLACFGFKTKKKRRKSRNISSSVEQSHGSYLALIDSDVFIKLDTTEKHNTLDSEIKEKPKEASISKIKNQVSFNLNVEAYEPIHNEEDINTFLSDSEEEEQTKWEFNTETTSLMATLHFTQDSISSRINKSYPQNHRYRNCSTDEIYEEEDDGYEFEDDLSSYEDKGDNYNSENDEKNSIFRQNLGSKNEEIEGIGSDLYANDRKKHVLSVLSPVENLSQWKAVKAKVAPPRHEKENAVLDHEYEPNTPKCHPKEEHSLDPCALKNMKSLKVLGDQGRSVTVDASLSNWLRLT
ncbi:uncharacterized protein [Primulina huaijiensis]|uniref:uncharacterized protein n=1 Tax=Primulina huaijiensis TaxID=1492673 RepID=UPI003CC70176